MWNVTKLLFGRKGADLKKKKKKWCTFSILEVVTLRLQSDTKPRPQ